MQNYTSVALAKHFLRLGGRLRSTSDNNTTTANSNGTFSYNSICDYAGSAAANAAGIACNTSAGLPVIPANNLSSFQITKIMNETVAARMTDVGLYAEDDWKVKPNLTFSYGLRYETQNFIHDHHDFAPRVSTAYGITKKTVIRAGAGIFYDRFSLGNQLAVAPQQRRQPAAAYAFVFQHATEHDLARLLAFSTRGLRYACLNEPGA